MASCLPRALAFSILGVLLAALWAGVSPAAELIPPSRTLEDRAATGTVAVYSEPPELPVFVDGLRVGVTPLFALRLPAGDHRIRVHDAEAEVTVAAGAPLRLRYIDGRLARLPERDQPPAPASGSAETPRPSARGGGPSDAAGRVTYDPLYFPLNPRGPIY